VKAPLREVLRTDRIGVLRVAALALALTTGACIGLTYMNVYLTKQLGYTPSTVLSLLVATILPAVLLQPLAGHLSDRFGRRPLLLAGPAGYLVLPYPALQLMEPGNIASVVIGLLLMFIPYTLMQAVAYPAIAELNGGRVRFTGVSLGFNVGAVLGGGLSPYLAAALVGATRDRLAPAHLFIAAALIGALALVRFKETAHAALRHRPAVSGARQPTAAPRKTLGAQGTS
jgi:MHS family proline/betaine transporter-like MFS transporter